MLQFHIFPGGVRRIVTFSYDDGSANDTRLVELFNRYGVKGTFHLNASKYSGMSREEKERVAALYAGHEIACHTVHHGWLTRMPAATATGEVLDDRRTLEEIAGYPVRGMSYPSGDFDGAVENILDACGIVYSRTTHSTNGFFLPGIYLAWDPTCHHRNALPLIDPFLAGLHSEWGRPLFYIWGHSHEFRTEEDWANMECIVSRLAGNSGIWYATGIEIRDYLEAQRRLEITADETVIHNPSAVDVWVERNKRESILIPAGQTVRLS